MKNFLLPVLGLLFFCPLFAQQTVPQGINYQAVLRNGNDVLPNKPAVVTFTILNGSSTGTLVFQEKYDTSSNSLGQLILVIGQGTHTGGVPFANIDWSQGPKFLKIEATVDGSTTILLGTPQIQSVPYALAAHPIGTAGGDLIGQYPNPNVAKLQGNPVSSTPPAPGLVLKWNGSEWAPASDIDTGDNWGTQVAQSSAPLTGNGNTAPLTLLPESITSQFIQNGAIQTIDVADGAVTAAKLNNMGASNGQILKWNGSAWAPAQDIDTGDDWGAQVAQSAAPLTGDGNTTPLTLLTESITSQFIQNGAIQTIDIANGAITAAKLSNMGASNGQILKWNGSAWAPAQDIDTGDDWGAQIAQSAAPLTGDGNTTPLTLLTESIASQFIQNGTIQTIDVANGAITAAKLNNMGASNGQILEWNGSAWAPANIDAGDDWGAQVAQSAAPLTGDGSNIPLTILSESITSQFIQNGTIQTIDVANGAITAAKLNNMGANTGEVLKWNGTTWVSLPDNDNQQITLSGNTISLTNGGLVNLPLEVDGSVTNELQTLAINGNMLSLSINGSSVSLPGPDNWGSQVVVHNTSLTGNGAGTALGIAPDGVTAIEIATSAVTTTEILNNTILAADLSSMGATTNGQVLKWNGSAWAPGADNTGSGQSPCGRLFTSGDVGIMQNDTDCPDDDYRLTVKGGDKRGVKVDAANGADDVQGVRVEATGGSGSNDGIILFSRSGANEAAGVNLATGRNNNTTDAVGLYIQSGLNANTFDDVDYEVFDNNSSDQNYGVYAVASDNGNNNSDNSNFFANRDIGIYARSTNFGADWAAYFEGDMYTINAYVEDDLHILDYGPTGSVVSDWRIDVVDESTGNNNPNGLSFFYNGSLRSHIDEGNGFYWYLSDETLKENILSLNPIVSKLKQLKPVSYNFIGDEYKRPTIGFISQEVEKIFPELTKSLRQEDGSSLMLLNYDGFSVIAIKAIQEQQAIIEAQQTKIENQEARLTSLEKEMAELRALVKSATAEKADKGSKK